MKFLLEPTPKRHEILLQQDKPICNCKRCDGPVASKLQLNQIASDSGYIFISKLRQRELNRGLDTPQTIIDKCVAFLTKFGRMTWCDEIGLVVHTYTTVREELMSGRKTKLRKKIVINLLVDELVEIIDFKQFQM